MHAHRTPFLVSSVEVVGDNVWASLGPGHLLRFGERGAAAPCEEGRYTNSAVLTTDGRSLIFGTTWDGVFVDNVWQGGMRKYCRGVAVDDEHIYAAYDDDKVRVHRRTDFKRVAILKDSAKVALGAGALATLNKQRTEIVLWDPLWHRELSRVPHGLSGQYPGISAFGGRFVVHTTDAVMVCEADGTHARRWQRPESDTRINAALLVGEDLVVGIAEASRNGGRILRIPLAALT
jgi:hypothetical protein